MEFPIKIWRDRVAEYLNRRKLTNVNSNEEMTVDVERDEGLVREPGNQFSALEMNDLENRIKVGFDSVEKDFTEQNKNMKQYVDSKEVVLNNTINTKDTATNNRITALANSVPIIQRSFTLAAGGWGTYSEGEKALFIQQVTGIPAQATDRFDCTCSAYYDSFLYASLIPINSGGALYVTTSIKPTVNVAIQVFLTPTRS